MQKLIAPARLINLRMAFRRARNGSPYWSTVLPDVAEEDIGLDSLSGIPIHTSADLARLSTSVRCRSGVPDSVMFTGGTTGSPLPIYHATKPPAIRPAGPDGEAALRPLGLSGSGGVGGPSRSLDGQIGLLLAPMRHRAGYRYAVSLLTSTHDFEGFTDRIRYVALPLPMLKRLMYLLAEEGCGPEDVDVRSILTWGYHLSPKGRARIEAAFPLATIDCFYGFTETSARASNCRECGAYHYGPDAVWEALDLQTEVAVTTGLGRMVVTPLSDRDTMLFRYAPGDVVFRTPRCSLVGEPGFRFAGRETQMISVVMDSRTVFPVWPVHVQEAVDDCHWIDRYNARRHTGMTPTEGDGHPMWRIRSIRDGRGIAVDLQLHYDPRLFPEAWGRHRARVLTSLTCSSEHPEAFQGDAPVVEIVGLPPGTLSGEEVFRC